jgi:hypothetical protein
MGRIVIACYRPKPGGTARLRELMATHHARLHAQGLVTDRRPVLMEAADGAILEVFEWRSKEAIEQAHHNPAVLAMWEEFGACCDYVPAAIVAEISQLFSEFTPLGP